MGLIANAYFHIYNGGLNFSVETDSEGNAYLVVNASSFGVQMNEIVMPIDKKGIAGMKELFEKCEKFLPETESENVDVIARFDGVKTIAQAE